MAANRYEDKQTGAIVTAWQYNGEIINPHSKDIPAFICSGLKNYKLYRTHRNTIQIEKYERGVAGHEVFRGYWITDNLDVYNDTNFNLKYKFYA